MTNIWDHNPISIRITRLIGILSHLSFSRVGLIIRIFFSLVKSVWDSNVVVVKWASVEGEVKNYQSSVEIME